MYQSGHGGYSRSRGYGRRPQYAMQQQQQQQQAGCATGNCPQDQVMRAPTPPPQIQRVVQRAPTPEPGVINRTIIRPQARTIIQKVIQTPRQPPPMVVDREICEPSGPPIINTVYQEVDHSPRYNYGNSYATQGASSYASQGFDGYRSNSYHMGGGYDYY